MTIVHATRPGLRPAALALALALLAGCAGSGGSPGTPDPSLLEGLSETRWAHLVAGEFGQAWEYFSPGYQSTVTKAQYAAEMADRPVRWTGAEYQGHECAEPESCEVKVKVAFKVRVPVHGVGEVKTHRVVTEHWIFLGGRWVYLPPEAVR